MECLACGSQGETEMVVHKDDPETSAAHICARCRNRLLANRQTENRCGLCEQFAEYGTQKLKRLRDPGSVTATDSMRVFDQYLLCEDHLQELQSGSNSGSDQGFFAHGSEE